MNKQSNKMIYLTLLIIFVGFFLTATQFYFNEVKEERFYNRTKEDYDDCLTEAKRDNVDPRWCGEIKSASIRTYNEARSMGNNLDLRIIFLISAIFLALIALNEKFEKLKDK